ncbi:uncharacterized protein LOC108668482 [Hyalella azteca]|uniref:Uncharacterized protein LOC108668482 n=1 Tax=Hyalella azteca TaxID=294128 RepID=A0A8B7NC74_HYAAZ|nr:uncharacterized protein LOC108668482 [Hyalella azteca]
MVCDFQGPHFFVTYAAPVLFPIACPAISKLKTIQNSALLIATGSFQMASASHLHSEAEVLPVTEYVSLLCSQYLASALRPHHPATLSSPRHRGPLHEAHASDPLPSFGLLPAGEGVPHPRLYSTALSILPCGDAAERLFLTINNTRVRSVEKSASLLLIMA